MTHPAGWDRSGEAALPDGGALHWVEAGDPGAPALLLVRPLGGTVALWEAFRDALVGRFRVVAFDHRGSGHSSPARPGRGTRAMARDAVALLDALALPRAHVFGISLGGMVATWLAADVPDRVDGLVLASTLPRGVSVSAGGAARALTMARALARPAREAEAQLARRVLSRAFRENHPDRVREIERALRGEPASRAGILALLTAAATHDARHALDRVRARTLVLAGENDPLVSRRAQRALVRGIAGAQFALVPAAGHDLTLEAPVETATRVTAFLAV